MRQVALPRNGSISLSARALCSAVLLHRFGPAFAEVSARLCSHLTNRGNRYVALFQPRRWCDLHGPAHDPVLAEASHMILPAFTVPGPPACVRPAFQSGGAPRMGRGIETFGELTLSPLAETAPPLP